MCTLFEALNKQSVTGYKVVAKHNRTGEYYSVACGFKYKQPKMTFGRRSVQKRLSTYFVNGILSDVDYGFKCTMVGRTGAFTNIKRARRTLNQIKRHSTTDDYEFVIVMVRLTDGLMDGYYGNANVVAGRTMEILGEVNE